MASLIKHLRDISAARDALADLMEGYDEALKQDNLPKLAFYVLVSRIYDRATSRVRLPTKVDKWEHLANEIKIDHYDLARILNSATSCSDRPEESHERFGQIVSDSPKGKPEFQLTNEEHRQLVIILHHTAAYASMYGFITDVELAINESGELTNETLTITW